MEESPVEPSRQCEPIAIVGIGCRLPGKASSPSKLWELLIKNETGHCPVPPERYNAAAYYHPDSERPGSINSTGGYFIQENIRAFENAFFGINNLEATSMDAQQRKLLEVTYEALENAGVPLEQAQGSNTGVYVGNFTNDYLHMQFKDPDTFSRFSAAGAGLTIMANRITHSFDLRGPSHVIDTACSSSLYALHSACLALEARDCDAAIVATANLIQAPEQQMATAKAGILSPDAMSHTFDESANGYGRAEAVSAIYVKRLGDAIRDGDPIRSIIRGTSVNANGRTPGIIQPSVEGQKAVIRAAYRRAGLDINDTDYVEAHGTGTKVGDPIEVEAIAGVFSHRTGRPTLIGGIKPNLGHSEGASALSSVIKVTLALENKLIPATPGIKVINPSIKLEEWNVAIVTANQAWPAGQVPRASISSFGFGGANSHAVLEAPQTNLLNKDYESSPPEENAEKFYLLPLSARSGTSLRQMAINLASFAANSARDIQINDLAFTLSCHRSKMATRGFFIESQASLNKGIDVSKLRESDNEGPFPFVFVYTGQGAQWAGMGKELLVYSQVFKQTINYLDSCLREIDQNIRPIWTLEALLRGDENFDISAANISQPVCTAVQIALTDLLKDWSALPKIVVGHSSGEIAAAYAAGFIDARQAILAAYFRGVAVTEDSTEGSMAAVGLGKDLVRAIIEECALGESVTVACANSPDSTTVSGDTVAVDDLLKTLQEREIWNRKLKTGGKAYHSHHMKVVGSKYEALLERYWNATNGHFETTGDADNAASSVEMISTVTGEQISRDQVAVPRYWRTNLESPVRFDEAIQHILSHGSYHLVELGPHSALQLPIKQNASALEGTRYNYNSSLMRHHDAWFTTLQLVGSLFLHRHDELRYSKMFNDSDQPQPHVLVDLPPYPWDYSKPLLWSEPRMSIESRHRKYPRHDLLGSQVLGGSTAGMTWRNVLSLHESEWLTDHRLGPSVVFPAAGYISMAVEAMCQVSNLQLEDCPGVELRQLNFAKALDMDLDRRPTVEIFSEMSPMRITNLKNSDNWWRFTVVSVDGDSQATEHMNAAVRLAETPARITRGINHERSEMQQDAARVWYERFTQEGLAYGPRFAVMEEVFRDRARAAPIAAATTHLQRGEKFCRYIAHPATIDAMLQTALVATTSGIVSKMRATVPVAMDSVYIAAPSALDMNTEKSWGIDGDAEKVGFGTFKCNAELFNSSGQVLVRLSKIRCIAYQGNIPTERTEQRDPIVRGSWKPDLSTLTSSGLESYLNRFVQSCESETTSEDVLRLAGVLDLACHQRSNINILELGSQSQIAEGLREILRVNSSFRRYNNYCRGVFANGDLVGADVFSGTTDEQIPEHSTGIPQERKFDIVLAPSIDLWTPALASRLTPDATVIIMGDAQTEDPTWKKVIKGSGSSPITVALINSGGGKGKDNQPSVVVVTRHNNITPLDSQIQKVLQDHWGSVVSIVSLSQVSLATVPDRSFVVSTLEQQLPLLNTIDDFEMGQIKLITDRAAKIVWLTNGGLMDGENPDFAPILGLSRSLMLEQPSLQFAVLDVDDNSIFSHDTSQNIVNIFERLIHEPKPDFEFAQRDGVLHISRWEPDERLNKNFRLKQNEETIELPLESAGRCQLSMKSPGQLDTIHFVQEDYSIALHPDYVEISVKSIGMNAKDLYALNAKIDIKDGCCSLECAGVITAVGDNISEFKTGDRVVAMAGTHFATVERLPHWAVVKLNDDEDFATSSTIPTVFSTAIYALKTLARLQPGETVLIHSGAGGVGIAAIQYAKHLGAKIFATVGTESKKSFLVEKFDMNPDHIFSSRNSSFLPAIMEATSGQGVDVVLNSLTGDLLRSSFEACASFGRFIEIGERDIMDHGSLDMFTFGRNVSFMAFSLSNICLSPKEAHHQLWKSLITESLDLVRSKICEPCFPIKKFDASEITDAFRYFSQGTRVGKVTVSFQDPSTKIKVIPRKYEATFSADKSYIMVGCLGGLGRSLSKWMISCGARRFVFLGRSGSDKPEARAIVNDLLAQGADVTVIRGDVCRYEDVERAMDAAESPIGGVIQAAMALQVALWSGMSQSAWHTTLGPKVQGTWNLHNALRNGRDSELDFFVMTSSVSGIVGSATESNYCAANAFLDAFARYRNSLGLPAISISYGMITEVGFLHEHPEIEALMKRKGFHPINEDELIQIMNLALINQRPHTWDSRYDQLSGSHIITGVESVSIQELRKQGFEGENHAFADPRAALLTATLERQVAGTSESETHGAESQLPENIARALRNKQDPASILDALRAVVLKKLSNLILLPETQLEADQPMGEFGLDSMLAAEFRTYIFRIFEVDVPFVVLLKRSTTVNLLTGLIAEGLQKSA